MDNTFIGNYKKILHDMIPLNIPELRYEEIEDALNYSIQKRFQDHNISINNNYKKAEIDMKLSKLMDYILDKKPIITPYGVMYSRHGSVPNPLAEMIDSFLETRSKYKNEMFRYPKGSEEFNRFNLLQLVAKVDTNA